MFTYKHIIPIIKNLFTRQPKRVVLPDDAPDRRVTLIVLHCTNTEVFKTSVSKIKLFWRYVNGWKKPGYHFIIEESGELCHLQDIRLPAHGAKGFDSISIHIAYLGGLLNGVPTDTRTFYQTRVMQNMISQLLERFPKAIVLGYCDLPGVKANCPCFDARAWWESVKHYPSPGFFTARTERSTPQSTGFKMIQLPEEKVSRKIKAKKAAH